MYLLCHYSEIGLKCGNRRFFEEKFVENIRRVLSRKDFKWIKRISGAILIELTHKGERSQTQITKNLQKVFGLANFSFVENTVQNIDKISEKAVEMLKKEKFNYEPRGVHSYPAPYMVQGKTFRVSANRANKQFPLKSPEIGAQVGERILAKIKAKVNLTKPEVTCFVDIIENYAFVYIQKIAGPGGLPMNTSGRAVALISGGIDSPVAAFEMMRRGLKNIFVHFHSAPFSNRASVEKVEDLIKIIAPYQGETRAYFIPFGEIQKEILLKCPAKLRVILYRRFMLRIAEEIAKKENALALITGESLGQVASQTLENICATDAVVSLPILRPLISLDKEKIIEKAKALGTYTLSILPHQDCCTRFLPDHPETHAKISEIKNAEKNLDIKKLIDAALKKNGNIPVLDFNKY